MYFIKYNLMQFKLGRKMLGGNFYLINPIMLPMASFWSDKPITSCGSIIVLTETH